MNYEQVVAEVVDTVKRPDKANLIARKVNAAITFCSLDNDFSRDLKEQLVSIDPNEFTQSFSLSDLERFRKFKYLKLAGTKIFLDVLADSSRLKPCNDAKKYYIAGNAVNIFLPSLASNLDVGYFQYPPILQDDQTHWIIETSPYMIIDHAAAEVFKDIGDEKSYGQHKLSFKETYLAFRRDAGISTQ